MKIKLRNPFKRKRLAKQIPKTGQEDVGQKHIYESEDEDGSSSLRNSSIISDDDDDIDHIPIVNKDSRIYYEQEQNVLLSRELIRKLSISSQRSSDLIDLKTPIQNAEDTRRKDEAALRNIGLGDKIGLLLTVPGRAASARAKSPETHVYNSPSNSSSFVPSPVDEQISYEREILYDSIPMVEIVKGHGKYYNHTIGKHEKKSSASLGDRRISTANMDRRPSNATLERSNISMRRVQKRRDLTLTRTPKTVTMQSIDKILEDVESMILELDPEASKLIKKESNIYHAAVTTMAEGIVYDGILDTYLTNTQGK
jgi:hypothetical protein